MLLYQADISGLIPDIRSVGPEIFVSGSSNICIEKYEQSECERVCSKELHDMVFTFANVRAPAC